MQVPTVSTLIDNVSRDLDPRGEILSIVDEAVQNVSIITCNPDTIRSNHYHFEDFHYMYVVEGEIDYFFCDVGSEELKYMKITQGQTIFTPPNEIHATYFPINTKLVVSSGFARDEKTYEEDTVRVEFINDHNLDFHMKSYARK